ncbi:MAG: TlpA family protein disulfide reductase [Bacteroidales bacterium]|nr:TlpA family protein disulfide reductase [Bacteroidales bacterium]MCF8334790.1 TlpA family protein disulfide reductase [Bacteroidales bacterium]
MKRAVVVGLFVISFAMAGFAQELKVTDFDGLKPYLHKKTDTTYVVNFWATWCKPCVEEMPAFQKLRKEYEEKPFKLLLVSMDFPSQIDSRLKPYIKENNIRAQVIVLDDANSDAWIGKVSEKWSGALPATFIYNRDNRAFYEKTFEYHELKQIVENQIKR